MLRAKASERVRGPVWDLRRPRATYEARRGLAIACGAKGDPGVAGARGSASNVTVLIPPHLSGIPFVGRWSFMGLCFVGGTLESPPALGGGGTLVKLSGGTCQGV